MDNENKQQPIDQNSMPQQVSGAEVKRDPRVKFNMFALFGIVLTVAAWIVLSFDGEISLALSIAAFILSCFGLKAATRTWRNTAITSLVASAVLMVVLSAFMIVFFVGLKSI